MKRNFLSILIVWLLALFSFFSSIAWAAADKWMGIGLNNASINTLVIDPTNQNIIYAGVWNIEAGNYGSGVYKSSDGGGSWNWIASTNTPISSIVIDQSNPTTLYFSLNAMANLGTSTSVGGVYKSTDGGVTWNSVSNGLSVTSSSTIGPLVIDPSNSATLYVAISTGTYGTGNLYKSTNGGGSWNLASSGLTATIIYSLAIDPSNSATLYAGAYNGLTYTGGVYKSTNGGTSWSLTNNGSNNLTVYSLAIDPSTTTTIYAGTYGGGAYKSTNGGGSWSQINNGLPSYTNVDVLAINPSTSSTIYAGTGGGVYLSTDGGMSWNPDSNGIGYSYTIDSLAIDPFNPSVVYAGTYGVGAYKSTPQNECLFNWAETNYPALFPSGSLSNVYSIYTYRSYLHSGNITYLGVSLNDDHVYYMGANGNLQDEGAISYWLPTAGCQNPPPPQTECLFNWAEKNYPNLFAPSGSSTVVSTSYTYRNYSGTNAFLGVSSANNHVYYRGINGTLQDEGAISNWLPLASCQ